LNLEEALRAQWLLTNNIGGYSSSTILGLNTEKAHGLLVSASLNLARKPVILSIEEEVEFNNHRERLWMRQTSSGIDAPGKDFIGVFKYNLDSVSWDYDLDGVKVSKKIELIPNKNALLVGYEIENQLDSEVKIEVKPVIACPIETPHNFFKKSRIVDKAALLSTPDFHLLLYSEELECSEAKNEENAPFIYTGFLEAGSKKTFRLLSVGYASEQETVRAFKELTQPQSQVRRHKMLSSGMGGDLIAFTAACDSFLVDYIGKKTILAGYPSLGQCGRDAMIAIPGLTLVNRRFDVAERIFEHFLNHIQQGRIPSEFKEGVPEFNSIDPTLWMVNSLHEYGKHAGYERLKKLLKTYWPELKETLHALQKHERNGLLVNHGETWMHSIQREGAVEVQALWYNALKILQYMGAIVGDKPDIQPLIVKFEQNFMKTYWNGSYLNDTLSDKTLRPNQLIALTLDHNVVHASEAQNILKEIQNELSTEAGIRTLSEQHPKYSGQCPERSISYYNGGIWPWLTSHYHQAEIKLNPSQGRKNTVDYLTQFMKKHLKQAGLGYVSEVYDGHAPHTPRGNIAHAANTAELMHAYKKAII